MQNAAIVITSSATINSASSDAVTVPHGFQGVLVREAASYGAGTVVLQLQGREGTWINASADLDADGLTDIRVPAGQYRVNVNTSLVTGLTVVLCPTP
jgi:hypothetical protein